MQIVHVTEKVRARRSSVLIYQAKTEVHSFHGYANVKTGVEKISCIHEEADMYIVG